MSLTSPRKKYETVEDVEKQEAVISHMRERFPDVEFDLLCGKNVYKYRVDYFVRCGDDWGVIEVKCRGGDYDRAFFQKQGSYMLGLDKYLWGCQYAQLGGKAYLVVLTSDGFVYSYRIPTDGLKDLPSPVWAGRTYRQRDAEDKEPSIYVPWSEFKAQGQLVVAGSRVVPVN